jgi:ABC-type antimicrobial peptide transport system permease subunit
MSALFKGLATTVIWVLFIFGLIRLIVGLVMAFSSGPDTASIETYLDFFVAICSLTLSVVVMKLRQSML